MEEISSENLITVTGNYTFRMGEVFQSYEELEKRLELHCAESLVYYWRRDTRTVKGAYTKTSRPIASRLKYYSLRYACVFGGEKKKSRSQGKRQNNKTLRKNCPAFIMLRASKDGRSLEVVGVNNEHNHDCSNYANKNLPHTRKLPEDIKQEVVEMMLMHIDRKKIIEYVKRKTKKSITVKDLFNMKAKYKNVNMKLERNKDEVLQSMGLSPSSEQKCENDVTLEHEAKEYMSVCYDANVIEYDEYSDCQDDANVEIDAEVNSDNLVEFTESTESHIEDTHELHDYNLDQEKFYFSTDIPSCPLNSTIQDNHEIVEVDDTLKQSLVSSTEDTEKLKQNQRTMRLKWFIQRENNRLKKKLLNCRICGTNPRFPNMQIGVLEAEKQKLLEETSILRLTKEKLINQVAETQLARDLNT